MLVSKQTVMRVKESHLWWQNKSPTERFPNQRFWTMLNQEWTIMMAAESAIVEAYVHD